MDGHLTNQKLSNLSHHLRREMEETQEILRGQFPSLQDRCSLLNEITQHKDTEKDVQIQRIKEFNPTSRDHIAWILTTHFKVKLSKITTTGKPIIDEITLTEIDIPFSKACAKCLTIKKKLGMISEGVNAWNRLVTTKGRIHHHCSVSTNTFRCAHRKPNLAQVPADKEFRELFTASPRMVMVGADLSGIELRMLAHYLGRYDGGRYADILLNDDIHQVNADKIGITRRQVKTVTYAFLYGAGNKN